MVLPLAMTVCSVFAVCSCSDDEHETDMVSNHNHCKVTLSIKNEKGDTCSRFRFGENMIFCLDFLNTSTSSFSNLRGAELYNAAKNRCNTVLNQCKKHNVLFRISNYARTLPWLNEKHERLINKLKSYGIRFSLSPKDATWMDYGFEYFDRHGTPEELSVAYDQCNTPCHEIRGSKFYFCVMARSVSENMGRNVGVDDCLDLSKLHPIRDKRLVFEYMMGYSDKGYLDMCNYCHGADSEKYIIPVAEQIKDEQ